MPSKDCRVSLTPCPPATWKVTTVSKSLLRQRARWEVSYSASGTNWAISMMRECSSSWRIICWTIYSSRVTQSPKLTASGCLNVARLSTRGRWMLPTCHYTCSWQSMSWHRSSRSCTSRLKLSCLLNSSHLITLCRNRSRQVLWTQSRSHSCLQTIKSSKKWAQVVCLRLAARALCRRATAQECIARAQATLPWTMTASAVATCRLLRAQHRCFRLVWPARNFRSFSIRRRRSSSPQRKSIMSFSTLRRGRILSSSSFRIHRPRRPSRHSHRRWMRLRGLRCRLSIQSIRKNHSMSASWRIRTLIWTFSRTHRPMKTKVWTGRIAMLRTTRMKIVLDLKKSRKLLSLTRTTVFSSSIPSSRVVPQTQTINLSAVDTLTVKVRT